MPGSYPLYFWLGTLDHLHMDILDDIFASHANIRTRKSEMDKAPLYALASRVWRYLKFSDVGCCSGKNKFI